MINSLSLQNFQSHKASLFTFSPGVNVIIGASDTGKTAVVRALRWIIHNRPAGTDFISYWDHTAVVKVEFDDLILERMRSEQKNCYVLNGSELVGFGQDVPVEVISAINMDERNIQYQLDGPFLLNESPGAVARLLNKIVNLDKIDSALANVRKLDADTKNNLKSVKQRLSEVQAELSKAPDFVSIDKQLVSLTKWQSEKAEIFRSRDKLDELLAEIETNEERLEGIVIPDVDLNPLDEFVKELEKVSQQRRRLGTLVKSLTKQSGELERNTLAYERCQVELKSKWPNLCPLCGQQTKFSEVV